MSVDRHGRPRADTGTVVASVLLPPLGVYRDRGPGTDFWVACGLTVVGFLPGVGFALYTVLLRPEARIADRTTPAAGTA